MVGDASLLGGGGRGAGMRIACRVCGPIGDGARGDDAGPAANDEYEHDHLPLHVVDDGERHDRSNVRATE
jgi:hypothetical protein